MDTIVLRTMAWNSRFNFGKFSGKTVKEVFDQERGYLIWCYFCRGGVSFLPEILDIINIKEEDRINKPGTDVIFYRERQKRNIAKAGKKVLATINKESILKAYARLDYLQRDLNFSKSQMQAMNCGRMRFR